MLSMAKVKTLPGHTQYLNLMRYSNSVATKWPLRLLTFSTCRQVLAQELKEGGESES
jgi:hypothetical protein